MEKNNYTKKEVLEMFKLYKQIDNNLGMVSGALSGNPRIGYCLNEKENLKKLIPKYRN
jgi:hypothetical protein